MGWGLHLPEGRPDWLGIATDRETELIFAKFVSSPGHPWHGYPADQRRSADIPLEAILEDWMSSDLFTRAKVRKIIKGQKCSP